MRICVLQKGRKGILWTLLWAKKRVTGMEWTLDIVQNSKMIIGVDQKEIIEE